MISIISLQVCILVIAIIEAHGVSSANVLADDVIINRNDDSSANIENENVSQVKTEASQEVENQNQNTSYEILINGEDQSAENKTLRLNWRYPGRFSRPRPWGAAASIRYRCGFLWVSYPCPGNYQYYNVYRY